MNDWDCNNCPGEYEINGILDIKYIEVVVEVKCENCQDTAIASYRFHHIDLLR